MNNKKRVAVIFGGVSPEHEVSIISGLQVIEHIDREKFDVLPVYVAKDGRWYSSPELTEIETFRNLLTVSEKSIEETISFNPKQKGLRSLSKKSFFSKSTDIKPIDIIFPAFHGGLGENGGFSGIYEAMDLPYVGPGVTGGTLGMDKIVMKQLFMQTGIPIAKWCGTFRTAWEREPQTVLKNIEKELKYPMFIKPATGGSSIGTTKAHDKKELTRAIEVASMFDRRIVVEESIEKAREINVSVIGNTGSALEVSVCEEVFSTGEVLTYEDKYVGNGKASTSNGMAQTKRQIPADIPKEIEKRIQQTAKKVFETLDGSGISRIDFLYQEKTNKIFVIESNTIPGSLSFYLWEASGLSFKEMITKLLDLAVNRYEEGKKNTTTFSTNILENFNIAGSKGKV